MRTVYRKCNTGLYFEKQLQTMSFSHVFVTWRPKFENLSILRNLKQEFPSFYGLRGAFTAVYRLTSRRVINEKNLLKMCKSLLKMLLPYYFRKVHKIVSQ